MYKDNPEFEYLEWLVYCRSENQKASLQVYRLFQAHRDIIPSIEFAEEALRSLTDITFSLWRAVFLTDNEDGDRLHIDTEEFLHNLIANNTVGYTQDKKSRGWSFNYYVDNARYRLHDLKTTQKFLIVEPGYRVNKRFPTAQKWWEYHQGQADVAITNLATHLLRESLPR